MVVKYDWSPVIINVSEGPKFIQLKSSQLLVKIYKSSFKIDVYDKNGKLLSSENVDNGGITKNADTVACTKQMSADEHFFGFGERDQAPRLFTGFV